MEENKTKNGKTELDNQVYKNRLGEDIRIYDIVYNNFQGESGMPLRVQKFREKNLYDGRVVVQAHCSTAEGWNLGSDWYAVQNLVHTPNLWGRWPDDETTVEGEY